MARPRTQSTGTQGLIDEALSAQTAFDAAVANLQAAAAARAQAEQRLKAANLALYTDLDQNGPAVTIDDSQTPPIVTVYTAVSPDSWKATEIRVAA